MIFYTNECEEKIGYVFKDKFILRRCFTHKSYANEHNAQSYETLEYLGDAILDFVVADYLFKNVNGDEGVLTKRRSDIVSAKPIAEATLKLGLEKFILLGEGERNKPIKMNICSDIFESVIAGLYLDGGLEVAKKFIYENLLNITKKESKDIDYKSKLQEYAQKKKLGTIKYVQIEKRGPDHSPEFTCAVNMGSKRMESGVGKNKKQAEQNAAKVTLQMLQTHQKRGKQN